MCVVIISTQTWSLDILGKVYGFHSLDGSTEIFLEFGTYVVIGVFALIYQIWFSTGGVFFPVMKGLKGGLHLFLGHSS